MFNSPYIKNIYKKLLKGNLQTEKLLCICVKSGWKLRYMHKSKEPLVSARAIGARRDWQVLGRAPPVLKERRIFGIGCDLVGGDHIWGGNGLLVCNFPLNKKRWLTFSIYISMNVLYYCFKNLMK